MEGGSYKQKVYSTLAVLLRSTRGNFLALKMVDRSKKRAR